jgi:AhpD family alkylhydroperoxidase
MTDTITPPADALARRAELHNGYRKLNRLVPDVMKGFSELHRNAVADGELSHLHKELIAMSIGIVQHCTECVVLHMYEALRSGATEAQVMEAIGVAILMGGGPASTAAADAVQILEDFTA